MRGCGGRAGGDAARRLDERVWRTAAWASPVTIQVVLGCVFATSCLVGNRRGARMGSASSH
jgi:hypothetical protein